MKNKKGFTLTELLAVLVILALLMTLAFPNFANLTSKAKANYDRSSQVLIKSAAKMYVNNNLEEVKKSIQEKGSYCLPIGKLVAYEYLDADLKKANNQPFDNDECIIVTKTEQTYQYNLDSNIKATGDYLPPIITITGTNCKSIMDVNSYTEFDNNCKVKATDNVNSAKEFKKIKENELLAQGNEMSLRKTVFEEKNKIYIIYDATDSSGNKALPLKVELILPE